MPVTAPPGSIFEEAPGLVVPFTAPFLGGAIASDVDAPEPASMLLMGAGLAGLFVGMRRKRAARQA